MGAWGMLQIVFDIFAALGFFVVIMRISRQPKDDPRLSRGLQLLQSKISVLEDLSDRTESQVNQLTAILDQKAKEVQAKVQLAEQHVHEIRVSMDRSLEVAKIFQDKIPHQEIIERQNTIKYVQAARLAHQGLAVEEIAQKVDLPKGEIEFIAKVNRDRLMFNEDQLPAWAQNPEFNATLEQTAPPQSNDLNASAQLGHLSFDESSQQEQQASHEEQTSRLRAEMEIAERQRLVENLSRLQSEMQSLDIQLARESTVRDMSTAFEVPHVETGNLQKLGEEFRKACENANAKEQKSSFLPPLEQLTSLIPQIFQEQDLPPQQVAQMAAAPVPMAAQEPQKEEARDPVLARAMAHAKVQAALAKGKAATPAKTAGQSSVAAARAVAREQTQPLIRKVEFPRIDK